ncbi:MAG TPA: hypothetical protein VKG38_04990 [Solirubrobacteraceae bacterium]|nr:hypothetical protein [Solirubrobacteraceae bacterium]
MVSRDPIESYLADLARQLRVGWRRRRRIVAELRGHLHEAAAAEGGADWRSGPAAERALARFGAAAETARQFNQIARARRHALVRRALVPWAAVLTLTLAATATVWAFQPSPNTGAALAKHVQACPHRGGVPVARPLAEALRRNRATCEPATEASR